MSPYRRIAVVGAVLAALSASGSTAWAGDPGADAAALALFAEGRRLMTAGDLAHACPKLAESTRMARGVGMMLNLALCYEGLGKTASAWSQFLEAAAAAHEKGQSEREAFARMRATRLEPQLLRATISIAPQTGAGTIEVKVDGKPLPNELLGVATPMDPGRRDVEASAPGRQTWVSTIDVQAGPASALEVPVLSPIRVTPPALLVSPVNPTAAPPEPRAAPDGRGMRTLGIVLGAAGVTTVGVGIAFALAAMTENDNSAALCRREGCLPEGTSDVSRAGTEADIASVAVPVGLAAVLGGVIVWLEAPRGGPTRTGRFGLAPSVSHNRWTLTATEAW